MVLRRILIMGHRSISRNNQAVVAVENKRVPSGQQMNFTATFSVLNDSVNHISGSNRWNQFNARQLLKK